LLVMRIGKLRTRWPVAAKTALATAGAKGGTQGSPMPVGRSVLCSAAGTALVLRDGNRAMPVDR